MKITSIIACASVVSAVNLHDAMPLNQLAQVEATAGATAEHYGGCGGWRNYGGCGGCRSYSNNYWP